MMETNYYFIENFRAKWNLEFVDNLLKEKNTQSSLVTITKI